jgi:hypothetical protein
LVCEGRVGEREREREVEAVWAEVEVMAKEINE